VQLSLIGINHISADINIRETVAVNTTKMQDALTLLRSYMPNGVILSTCNRTEIYFTCEENRSEKACLEFLKDRAHVDDASLLPCIYSKRNKQAVEHLFRVASGIESMIVGEFEVLGQVKYALVAAEKAGMVNLLLRRVFQSAVRTGRTFRSETAIQQK
jgi:glutamyl-tRNA reductase